MILDCIASGCAWVDMKTTGVDVLISAPQKGWSASPSAGLVMLSDRAMARLEETTSDSFALDLKKWRAIMQAYEDGGHAYHATMPTDGLRAFAEVMRETREMGFAHARAAVTDQRRDLRLPGGRPGRDRVSAHAVGPVRRYYECALPDHHRGLPRQPAHRPRDLHPGTGGGRDCGHRLCAGGAGVSQPRRHRFS